MNDSTAQFLIALVSSAFTTGVAFATLRTKMAVLEQSTADNKEYIEEVEKKVHSTRETFVSSQSMENALNHVYSQLNAMQKDIKDILRSVRQ